MWIPDSNNSFPLKLIHNFFDHISIFSIPKSPHNQYKFFPNNLNMESEADNLILPISDTLKLPKEVSKWIEFEKIVFTITDKNLKSAYKFIDKNMRLDQDQMQNLIVQAYDFIPHRKEQLKLLFKYIGTSQQIYDYRKAFVLDLYRSNIIKKDQLQTPKDFFIFPIQSEEDKLLKEIENDNLEQVTFLSSESKNENKKITLIFDTIIYNLTLIDYSALCGAVNSFKYFLLNGKDVTSQTVSCAVRGGNEEIVELLHQRNMSFNNTLSDAVISHNNELAMWIQENSTEQHVFNISTCAHCFNTEFLLYMLPDCIDNAQDVSAAVTDAISQGNLQSLQCIAENVNVDSYRNTLTKGLHNAALHRYLFVVRYLVQNKYVEIDATNEKGCTALHIAAAVNAVPIVKYLLNKKANINAQTTNGSTPLVMAAKAEAYGAMNTLVSFGAKDEFKDNDGKLASDYSSALNMFNIYN